MPTQQPRLSCDAERDELVDLGGTLRTVNATESLTRIQKCAKEIGITRLANVTGLDHVGIPTWMVIRPLALSLAVSQGKGLTHSLAKVSGLMESIEIHHAEHWTPRGHQNRLYESLMDRDYVDFLSLPIHPRATIDRHSSVEWVAATDLNRGEIRWIPRELVDLDFTQYAKRNRTFISSSNGLASGNTYSEALIHAISEVIERDQTSFWVVSQACDTGKDGSRVSVATIDSPLCGSLIEKCRLAGLEVCIWFVTSNISVPCFACVVYDPTGETYYKQRASGYGCHPYKEIALSRAITEALQSRLTFIAGVRDDVYWSTYNNDVRLDGFDFIQWESNLSSERRQNSYLDIEEAPTLVRGHDVVDWLTGRLVQAGIEEVIVLNLTKPAINIPVVYVTIPGLEFGIKKRLYSPGSRMQDYLRKLGVL